ncbi:hypothetical protein RN04_05310 [Arthrobacter sp. W1]|nr:hypothetical protein RN04_05310 [Arthrobacter sp. W1]
MLLQPLTVEDFVDFSRDQSGTSNADRRMNAGPKGNRCFNKVRFTGREDPEVLITRESRGTGLGKVASQLLLVFSK